MNINMYQAAWMTMFGLVIGTLLGWWLYWVGTIIAVIGLLWYSWKWHDSLNWKGVTMAHEVNE